MRMEYIKLNKENLQQEHICCALSKSQEHQVACKKKWLASCMEDGLVFLKANQRGKCFIEYVPSEHAWVPLHAFKYLYIDCLWVAGSLKGHGYSNDLLQACIQDAKDQHRYGICILSSHKKKPYLADPTYLKKKGFLLADTSDCGITLMYLPLVKDAPIPKFKECAKHPSVSTQGFVLYDSYQCPFTVKYVAEIEQIAKDKQIPFQRIHLTNKQDAQNCPSPTTTYALFYDGEWITNEILSEKKFMKLIEQFKNS